jgi:hypothetical protein
LTWTLDGGEWTVSLSGRFSYGGIPLNILHKMLGEPESRSKIHEEENILAIIGKNLWQ